MYQNSEVLEKIMKKYKIIPGMKLDIELLNKIMQLENMEINDLIYILNINKNTYYKLKREMQVHTKFKSNQYNSAEYFKYEEKINRIEFCTIQNKLGIENSVLRKLLGITKYRYNKMMRNEEYEVYTIDIKARHIVKLMKIDFKYMKKYGDRYYKIKELNKYCSERNITIDEFAKYYNNNFRHYKFNKMIIEKSECGFWISGKVKLSDEFINENYNELFYRCERLSNKMAYMLNCRNLKEDFVDIAISKIVEDGGVIVKTFCFDTNLTINILMAKARYAMFNYYIKEKKKMLYFYNGDNQYLDRLSLLKDEGYYL